VHTARHTRQQGAMLLVRKEWRECYSKRLGWFTRLLSKCYVDHQGGTLSISAELQPQPYRQHSIAHCSRTAGAPLLPLHYGPRCSTHLSGSTGVIWQSSNHLTMSSF
jgi:hypothetical protein